MNPIEQFESERAERIVSLADDAVFVTLSRDWLQASMQRKYVYNFEWMGRPIIQYPQDMVAMQELVWQVRPDLIIETGIAHGWSDPGSAPEQSQSHRYRYRHTRAQPRGHRVSPHGQPHPDGSRFFCGA